jgi:cob(I)alamin adenosyltransferase
MRIYTKTGDGGETSLFGGRRVKKDNLRIEACGSVDELNSVIGVVRSMRVFREVDKVLEGVQNDLFVLGADLATPLRKAKKRAGEARVQGSHVKAIEGIIDRIQAKLPPLRRFVLPGGSSPASHLHLARAVCRRAERRVVKLSQRETLNPISIAYMNRLSDLLFVLARFVTRKAKAAEVRWRGVKGVQKRSMPK